MSNDIKKYIKYVKKIIPIHSKDKKEFIRIVKNKDNEINIDRTGKMPGRGAYICDDIQCLEKLIKTKRLEKVFDMKISNEIYEKLRGVILDK